MEQRLRVDWIRCDGYGLCSDLAPDLIDLDDWRYPVLRTVPLEGALLHEAQRAIDCCPMAALKLVRASRDRDRG
ncbi:MAG TPA: ferredoxin [Candidatus Dormibacteraeota bacterium]|nr:ferredoxin [Candidatus Dormibacteraeota bacterium]